MRNAFNRYKLKVKEAKRLDYVKTKVDWFGNVRDHTLLENCIDAWKLYVKLYKNAKKFLVRATRGIDKVMTAESFTVWKSAMYAARRQVYITNIEELERRQEDHEQQKKELDHQI